MPKEKPSNQGVSIEQSDGNRPDLTLHALASDWVGRVRCVLRRVHNFQLCPLLDQGPDYPIPVVSVSAWLHKLTLRQSCHRRPCSRGL